MVTVTILTTSITSGLRFGTFSRFYRAMFVRAVEQPGGKFGGSLAKSINDGAITKQVGNPNQTFTGSHTVQSCQYVITQGTDRIVPGDTDVGNHCDGCDTFIPLPFNFQSYGATYTGVNVGDNGRLDFVNVNEPRRLHHSVSASAAQLFHGSVV